MIKKMSTFILRIFLTKLAGFKLKLTSLFSSMKWKFQLKILSECLKIFYGKLKVSGILIKKKLEVISQK